jgi:hypothetical protein
VLVTADKTNYHIALSLHTEYFILSNIPQIDKYFLCVCVCVYIYIYIYVCVCVYVYIYNSQCSLRATPYALCTLDDYPFLNNLQNFGFSFL